MLNFLTPYRQRQRIAEAKSARFDGHFIGRDGKTSAREYGHSVLTPEGDPQKPLSFMVNGMNCTKDQHVERMRTLAESGRAVIGVYNATKGAKRDLLQSVGDKLDKGHNAAVSTVRHLVRQAVSTGQQLSLVGHSQGALVCSRALWQVYDQLTDQVSASVAKHMLSKVQVETLAGAAQSYPPGPRYTHRAIAGDPIVKLTGLASPLSAKGSSDATSVFISETACPKKSLESTHAFEAFFSPPNQS